MDARNDFRWPTDGLDGSDHLEPSAVVAEIAKVADPGLGMSLLHVNGCL